MAMAKMQKKNLDTSPDETQNIREWQDSACKPG